MKKNNQEKKAREHQESQVGEETTEARFRKKKGREIKEEEKGAGSSEAKRE